MTPFMLIVAVFGTIMLLLIFAAKMESDKHNKK